MHAPTHACTFIQYITKVLSFNFSFWNNDSGHNSQVMMECVHKGKGKHNSY